MSSDFEQRGNGLVAIIGETLRTHPAIGAVAEALPASMPRGPRARCVFAFCVLQKRCTCVWGLRDQFCPRSSRAKLDVKWLIGIGLPGQDAANFKMSFLEKAGPSEEMDPRKLSAVTTLLSQLLNGDINIDTSVLDSLKQGTVSCPANDCVFGLLEAAPSGNRGDQACVSVAVRVCCSDEQSAAEY